MKEQYPDYFFHLENFAHRGLFDQNQPVWHAIKGLKNYIDSKTLGKIECIVPASAYLVNKESISIGKGTIIEPGSYIEGPAVIGENCCIRHGAYLRPYVLAGNGCVFGHSSEVKHSIFLMG